MTKIDVIEINGRRYDTKSGDVLDIVVPHKSMPTPAQHANSLKIKERSPFSYKKPIELTKPQHKNPHKREKSKTLLRGAVKKPVFEVHQKKGLKVSGSIATHSTSSPSVLSRHIYGIDRSRHATSVPKSSLVHKFSDITPHLKPPTEPIAVRMAPIKHDERPVDIVHKTPPVSRNPFDTAVERAIPPASSHKIKRGQPSLLKQFSLVVGVFIVVAVGVLYVEWPKLEVSLVAYKSGVAVVAPKWMPSGYSFKAPIEYSAGKVTLNYTSGSNSIRLTEQSTKWDNSGLYSNYVEASGSSYQTLVLGNQALYLFNGGNITWVNSNVWYSLSSTIELTNNQIENIVNGA